MKKIIISIIIILTIIMYHQQPNKYGDRIELDTGEVYIVNQYGNMQKYNVSIVEELKELNIYGKMVDK